VGSIYAKHDDFFAARHEKTAHAAATMAGIVVDVLGGVPERVLDVGCGVGTFLDAFATAGTTTISGIEGSWLNRDHVVVDATSIVEADLEDALLDVGSFDLVVSLEVAEHLSPGRAESFVTELCSLAPAVLFSAAIPLQGGVGHLNEQWPSWWGRHFAANGLRPLDCIRPAIWSDGRIATWYRQNTILYLADGHAALDAAGPVEDLGALNLVHPSTYEDKVPGNSISKATKALLRATRRTLRSGLGIRR
jgi:SAM-dependent methyltransferase